MLVRFDDLENKMRALEALDDARFMPGVFAVARVDGRSFTRLTKEIANFEAPFDLRFSDYMAATALHLCNCGFQTIYAYTQSDEISLLFRAEDETFQRKLRKWNSILASEAGAVFSIRLGMPAAFDCRIIPLPNEKSVVEYFSWRQEDAWRNALNAHCYWLLRRQGASIAAATDRLRGASVRTKHELLMQGGINFGSLPGWQKRGVGVYRRPELRSGFNPITAQSVQTTRQAFHVDRELPGKADYEAFVMARLQETCA